MAWTCEHHVAETTSSPALGILEDLFGPFRAVELLRRTTIRSNALADLRLPRGRGSREATRSFRGTRQACITFECQKEWCDRGRFSGPRWEGVCYGREGCRNPSQQIVKGLLSVCWYAESVSPRLSRLPRLARAFASICAA